MCRDGIPPKNCAAVIILALSSGGAKRKYFQTSSQGLLRNVTLQFHSRGWISQGFQAKTRCSPLTRMLTHMFMVQMSKHMDMQSRTTLFCNSLLEQSCTDFPCYQSAVWSGKCRVWSVECKVCSVECKVRSGEYRVCKV